MVSFFKSLDILCRIFSYLVIYLFKGYLVKISYVARYQTFCLQHRNISFIFNDMLNVRNIV